MLLQRLKLQQLKLGQKLFKGSYTCCKASYGYDVYQDIEEYDGADAAKAVTVETALTLAAGCAISGAGAPVAVVIVAGVVVSVAADYVGDKVKKWWTGK